MSGADPEMLEQFAIETQEHLDAIEPILLQAEQSPLDKPQIAALFRGFHSIKGLARLIDRRGLEVLSHHAESLLAEIRADRLNLTEKLLGLLLEATDGIRELREAAVAGGADSPPPAALLAALDQATNASSQTRDERPAAPIEAALHADQESLLYFAELLVEFVPALASLAHLGPRSELAAEALEVLDLASERLQLHGLRRDLTLIGGDDRNDVIDGLAGLIGQMRRFAAIVGVESGADALFAAIEPELQQRRRQLGQTLLATLGKDADQAADAARQLLTYSAAGLVDGAIASLLLQALKLATLPDTALPAAQLLADAERSATELQDLQSLAAAGLRDALAASWLMPAGLVKLLEDRGVAASRLGELDEAALGRLSIILEGGSLQLMWVAMALPKQSDRPGFLRRVNRRLTPISVRAQRVGEIEGMALLVVNGDGAAALQADLLSAHPDISPIEVRQLDDQVQDNPWATSRRGSTAMAAAESQVRVPVEILDRLFGRIGEFFGISSTLNALVVDSQVPTVLQRMADHAVLSAPDLLPWIDILQRQQSDLAQIEAEVHHIVSLIHESTLGLRIIPLEIMFNRFPRMIRELAKLQDKQIRFEARAHDIKVDKGMTELLADPLMHMLRNAVDHGIESPEQRVAAGKSATAQIRLTAVQNGNRIAVEIADDGRGIDAERVRLRAIQQGLITETESLKLTKDQIYRFIFAPGFSTAEAVTDTSGRGVGMDVALINVSRLGGRIDIQTIPGQGTTFRLDMPLSAAMQTVLLAETALQTVAFPERMVIEAATIARDSVQYVNGQRAILLHDRFLPLFLLTDLLRLPNPEADRADSELTIIVVASGPFRYGVEVVRVLRRHEMLIRETHPRVAQLPGVGGVSSLGTDRIVLVLDPDGLTDLARAAVVPGLRVANRAAE